MDPLIARMHESLVAAIGRARAGRLDQPVTVAEIYQDLIPYRNVRDALGLELNADYEHTLLRLLSGEGGCVRLEPEEARRELADELESPNPYVGLYRKFAGCDVLVSPARRSYAQPAATPDPSGPAAPAPDLDAEPARETVVPVREAAPLRDTEAVQEAAPAPAAGTPPLPSATPPMPAPAHVSADTPEDRSGAVHAPADAAGTPESTAGSETAATAACFGCDASLPQGREVRFCPFCGHDQRLRPCASCGEVLEPGWRFCIGCGAGIARGVESAGAA